MPCGATSMPEPNAFTILPVESNFITGGTLFHWPVLGSKQPFAPQRSATQMDLPSLSISTALVEPQGRPAGSLKKSLIDLYGLGASLVGTVVSGPIPEAFAPCAAAGSVAGPIISAMATKYGAYRMEIPRKPA